MTLEEAAFALGDREPGSTRTRSSLGRLTELHLVEDVAAAGGVRRYHPLSPAAAEAAGVERVLQAANEVVQQIGQARALTRLVSRAYEEHRRTGDGALTTHHGHAAVTGAIHRAARECRDELLTFQPGGSRARQPLGAPLPPTLALLDRGVQVRSIYQHSARASAATQDFVKAVHDRGGDVRTLNESFERLIVFDRKTVFIPGRRDRRTAVEIRQPGVADFLSGVFDKAWMRAKPFTLPNRNRATTQISDELCIAIMRHVVAGDTDAVTAQQLGISVRRCQEYIARVASSLGSRSRAQLGFLVAQSGLLEDG
ncbi:hypothetical protein [Kitasatospora cinereorecta]|uniref:LuxR family transcriptional regulator n=1 Tax=Kitasatospora cinereorecta TaxID=285560 RepID=A0ABW0VNT8_9ACTN